MENQTPTTPNSNAVPVGMVAVDHEICVGCGRCTEVCPEVFCLITEEENAGKADVCGIVTSENLNKTKEASDQCPVGAIKVKE